MGAKMSTVKKTWDELAQECEQLRADNDRLRAQLAASTTSKPRPARPRFTMSEGTRDELERNGKARDPWTGKQLTRDDLKG